MKKPPKIVEVEWIDIVTRSGSTEHREHETGAPKCRTVGYLLEDNDQEVVLSGSWSEADRADTTSIPRGVVRSVTELHR